MDFVKDHEELTDTLRTRVGRNACGRVVCQSVQDLVLIPKDSLPKNHQSSFENTRQMQMTASA